MKRREFGPALAALTAGACSCPDPHGLRQAKAELPTFRG